MEERWLGAVNQGADLMVTLACHLALKSPKGRHFSMLFLVTLVYPFLCSSVMVLVPFWSLKSIEISINIGLVGKSADMRLDRAGSIGLRVGPPQIAPKIQKKRARNPSQF